MSNTVLFVDDEVHVLRAVERAYRKEQFKTITASSGDEALEILNNTTIDIIVSDHRMPGITGAELLARVKEEFPSVLRIILSGSADIDTVIKCINDGEVYRFFTKPCDKRELSHTLNAIFKQKQLMLTSRDLLRALESKQAEIKRLKSIISGMFEKSGDITEAQNSAFDISEATVDYDSLIKEASRQIDELESIMYSSSSDNKLKK